MARPRRENSIYRIAEEAGVSTSTVSRVMNRRAGVSEETRALIDKLLRKYNFLPYYPIQRAPKIAFLLPSYNLGYYVLKMLNGVFNYVDTHGVEVSIVARSKYPKTTLIQHIRDEQCSGVIVGVSELLYDDQEALNASGLPVIFLDSQTTLPAIGFIDNDSYSGSCAAARHLLDLGHRKIGYLCHQQISLNHIQRLKGYEDTLRAAGITIQENWISRTPDEKLSMVRGVTGQIAMRQLLERAPEVTAVMAVDDDVALGAMSVIHESGRKIPDDISVVGFDNYSETAAWYPALTTVDHPIERGGYLAAQAIEEALANPGKWVPPREILPTKLVIRNSTAAPRQSN